MVTYEVVRQIGNLAELAFKGKTTDTKPTVTHDGYEIMNGSSFFTMDDQNVEFYDADSQSWLED